MGPQSTSNGCQAIEISLEMRKQTRLPVKLTHCRKNEVPVDFATIKAALKRKTWDEWIGSDELKSTFSYKITSGRPKGTASLSRELEDEVIINQLRTGKSALSRKCPTRYKGMTPEHAKCLECGEEDSVVHLLTYPVKGGIRRSITHNGRQ